MIVLAKKQLIIVTSSLLALLPKLILNQCFLCNFFLLFQFIQLILVPGFWPILDFGCFAGCLFVYIPVVLAPTVFVGFLYGRILPVQLECLFIILRCFQPFFD